MSESISRTHGGTPARVPAPCPASPCARRTGRPPLDRPLPARPNVHQLVSVPARLVDDARLDPAAILVALALGRAKPSGAAVERSNEDLARAVRLGTRSVAKALARLEASGWIYRLMGDDGLGLENLELVGYRDPWADCPRGRPARAIVLLWLLPEIPHALKERDRRSIGGRG